MGQKAKKRVTKKEEKAKREEERVDVAFQEKRRSLARRRQIFKFVKNVGIIGVAALVTHRAMVKRARLGAALVRSGATDARPLAASRRDVFGPAVAASLRSCLASRKPLTARFDNASAAHAKGHGVVGCLWPFFAAARDPHANAFVLNVLDCGAADDGTPWHLDETVAVARDGFRRVTRGPLLPSPLLPSPPLSSSLLSLES